MRGAVFYSQTVEFRIQDPPQVAGIWINSAALTDG